MKIETLNLKLLKKISKLCLILFTRARKYMKSIWKDRHQYVKTNSYFLNAELLLLAEKEEYLNTNSNDVKSLLPIPVIHLFNIL